MYLYYDNDFDQIRSEGKTTGKPYGDFISIVSDTKSDKSEKMSVKSRFSKQKDKFFKKQSEKYNTQVFYKQPSCQGSNVKNGLKVK